MLKRWSKTLLTAMTALVALALVAFWMEERHRIDVPPAVLWGEGGTSSSSGHDMVLVRGGRYVIGDDWPEPQPDAPPRPVEVSDFYIDRHEVTNRQFAEFVAASGHVTTAEREGAGWVYRAGERDWKYVAGADWKHPLGPDSSSAKAMDHPVVLISWVDAAAYANWAGKRLPTEAEWEIAARGGTSFTSAANLAHRPDVTGAGPRLGQPSPPRHDGAADPTKDGSANVWQGHWPQLNEMKDGFFYTAPVGSFAANAIGAHDMIGNVWEWTGDWYGEIADNPRPAKDPQGPASGSLKVARGGSWFCSPNYCGAYRPGFRGKSPPSHAFNNVGFRCARDARADRNQQAAR